MPPKAVPMSIPASAVKKRAIAKSATITMTSAVGASGRSTERIGITPPASSAVPKTRYGVKRKIQEAFSASTTSLAKSFCRSRRAGAGRRRCAPATST